MLEVEVDTEVSTTVAHEDEHEHGALGRMSEESGGKRVSHLPSPPLTRVGTNESVAKVDERGDTEEAEEGSRKRRSEVHFHPGSEIHLSGGEGQGEGRDDRASYVAELGRAGTASPSSTGRHGSQLRFHTKTPPTPQPWEVTHPPPAVTHAGRGHRDRILPTTTTTATYSARETARFAAMQSQTTARSLVPKSSYYFGPPGPGSAYGTRPIGQIGLHHPREILRIERDYTYGELMAFAPIFPLELEGRVTPKQFYETICAINDLLASAHSLRHSFFDNLLNVLTLNLGQIFFTSHYEKEMRRLERFFDFLNAELFNPVGLNILWPRKVAFLFLEIEYY